LNIGGQEISDGPTVADRIDISSGAETSIVILRDGVRETVTLRPTFDAQLDRYTIGIGLDTFISKVSYNTLRVPLYALREILLLTFFVLQAIWGFLAGLFSGTGIAEDVVGPIGLIGLGGQLITQGWLSVVRFAILLSANLAVINIIPFPALDGGRLFFQIIEVLRGRKINPITENRIHSLGFVLVLGLIFVITYRDILRLF